MDDQVIPETDDLRADLSATLSAEETPRDESGRYAPSTPAEVPQAQSQEQAAPIPAQEQQQAVPRAVRAPVSWKPEEREGWEQMHPHHQQAVMRREQEVSQALAHTADARKFYQEFANVVQPYMGFIQAENATPIQAVQNLMQTAAMLRTAPPSQKAALVAGIVSQYGVDLQMLDQALTAQLQGRRPSVNPNDQVLSLIDQKLQPFNQFLSVLEQRRAQEQQTITAEAGQSIEQFMADPANEFAQDVAEDMADILEHSARRGVQMDLQEAYKRATLLHPTISKIVESRAVGAAQQTAAAQRAKQASVSVSGSGAPNAGSNGADYGDLRSAIVAAAQEHAGRR